MAPLPSAPGLFGAGLSQHARLITLATAQDAGLPESLLAERFSGREGVNELFRFEVDALSVSTDLDLDLFLGEEITLKLLLADGSRRAWHGMCTNAAGVGADGGVARYRLRLEPALNQLRQRRDSYLFQDKNVRDIVTELLADYAGVRVEFELRQALAARPVRTQYRETDCAFLQRILAAEGLSWRFEHEQGDAGEQGATAQARHKLVIFDARASAPAMAGIRPCAFTACAPPTPATPSTSSPRWHASTRTRPPAAAGTRTSCSRLPPSAAPVPRPARCRRSPCTTAAASGAMPPPRQRASTPN